MQILHESCNIAEKSDWWFSVSGRVKIDVGGKCFSVGKRHQTKKNEKLGALTSDLIKVYL